jgi:hypothetical protein
LRRGRENVRQNEIAGSDLERGMERYYFSTREGETQGPVSAGHLRHMQIGGLLPHHTRVCREGTNIWRPIAPLQTSAPPESHSLKQVLAFVGSALLFIGVFCPIVSMPIMGQMNYFQNGKGDGTIILVLAAASAVVTMTKFFRLLLLTGGISLGIMIFTFIRFQSRLSAIKNEMQSDLRDNPFAGLADLAIQSVQIQWGMALLVLGAILVIAAGLVRGKA